MRIDNQTDWRTDQIRPILRRIALNRLAVNVAVTISYLSGRGNGVGGKSHDHWMNTAHPPGVHNYATVRRVELRLPKKGLMAADLAYVFSELIQRGHTKMRADVTEARRALWWSKFSWAIPLKIEKKTPPGPDAVTVKRLDAAWRSLKAAERKRKLYTTLTEKWKRRIKAYENKLAKGEQDGGQERPEETARLAV